MNYLKGNLVEHIKTFITEDGSIGLFNTELNEIYHSKFGAKKEAFEKFIKPCFNISNRPLKILDICYGIGYNTKCALENFQNIILIDCVEIDEKLAKKSFEFEYEENINKIIENNIKNPDFINFYFEDIRLAIKKLNKKYDIIFHDGFKPDIQPELWSEDLIFEISKRLDANGIYCTYNHSKPVLNALYKAGLTVGKTIENNKIIGISASFSKNLIKNPLNEFEIGQLNTKSAITYKDINLNSTKEEIINARMLETKNSNLMTLSAYKKLLKNTPAIF